MTRYSICITHKNDVQTLKASLDSIINQIDDSYEIIIVDSMSTDGSINILREYERKGIISLIVRNCSRGKGRQIAFEASRGEYVITNMDMDDVFKPTLMEMTSFYHNNAEGLVLTISQSPWKDQIRRETSITIASRELVKLVGGWKDLNWLEDWEFFLRASLLGVYRWTDFDILETTSKHLDRTPLLNWIAYRYRVHYWGFKAGIDLSANRRLGKRERVLRYVARITPPWRIRLSTFYPFQDEFNLSSNTSHKVS